MAKSVSGGCLRGRRLGRLRVVLTAGLLAIVGSPVVAVAQGAMDLEVDWVGDGVCPAPEHLEDDVRTLLAGAGLPAERPRFRIEVGRAGARLALRFAARTRASVARRRLLVGDCAEAVRAAGLLVALAIDPRMGVQAQPGDDDRPADPSGEEPPAEAAQRSEPPAEAPASRSPWRFGLSATAGMEGSQLPAPGLQLAAGGILRGPWWRLELFLSSTGPASAAVVEQPGAALSVHAIGLGGRACALVVTLHRGRLGPCVLVRGGVALARGTELATEGRARGTWAGAGLAVLLEWPLGEVLALQALASLEAGLRRPVFRIYNASTSHTLPVFNPQGALGVVLYL